MDVKSELLEKTCLDLTKNFSNYFNWNEIDLTLNHINIEAKEVYIISNNHEWQLMCWDDDLDLLVNERLNSGTQYWNNYSNAFKKTLAKADKRELKVDFCAKYGNTFEITTINSNRQLSLSDMMAIHRYHI